MLKLQVLALVTLLAACGGPLKYQVASSAKAPGADAKLVADVNSSLGQTQLEVEVANLAPADRVAAGSTSYVAWYRKGSDAQWSRIGALDYDNDDRKGELKGSVPETAFDFTLTAEKSGTPTSPSPEIVFSQRVAE